MNRRHFLYNLTLLTGALALGQQALAQGPVAPGPVPPGQTLPGPFGPFGSPAGNGVSGDGQDDDDDNKDADEKSVLAKAGDLLQDIGNWDMKVGGLLIAGGGGISTTGGGAIVGTPVAGFGVGLGLGGAIASGTGLVLDAISDDPPRPKYQKSPNCRTVRSRDFPSLRNASKELRNYLDANLKLYASSANTLAALELWGGAHAAKDGAWRARHRVNFVKYWNAMRKDIQVYSTTFEKLDQAFLAELKSRNLTYRDLEADYSANKAKIEARLSKEVNSFFRSWEKKGCTEIAYAKQNFAKLNLSRGGFDHRKVEKASQQLAKIASKLPVYK